MQDYYNLESPEASYSEDFQADDNEYPPYADDAQYFDIDISLPFSPTNTNPISSSSLSLDDVDSEDEFELDLSLYRPNPPNPIQCISPPADSLFDHGHLLPLQLIPTPQEHDMDLKDIRVSPDSSSRTAGIKTHFPKLLKTATKLKLSLFRFTKLSKLGMDLQPPCVECDTASMRQKLPSNNSYMSSEGIMTLIEVQGTIQGAIAHCKQSNHIHRW